MSLNGQLCAQGFSRDQKTHKRDIPLNPAWLKTGSLLVALLLEKDENASLLVFCIIYIYNKFIAPGTLKQPQPTHLHKMSWATQPDLSGPLIFPFAPFFFGERCKFSCETQGGKNYQPCLVWIESPGGTIHQKCWDSRKSPRFRNFSPL